MKFRNFNFTKLKYFLLGLFLGIILIAGSLYASYWFFEPLIELQFVAVSTEILEIGHVTYRNSSVPLELQITSLYKTACLLENLNAIVDAISIELDIASIYGRIGMLYLYEGRDEHAEQFFDRMREADAFNKMDQQELIDYLQSQDDGFRERRDSGEWMDIP